MHGLRSAAEAAAWLMTSAAVRERANLLFALAEKGELSHFTYHPERLTPAIDFVIETMCANYPAMDIPLHSRWRHFTAGGRDRWGYLAAELTDLGKVELTRIRFDLAVTSVLLDAGAGPAWRYRDSIGVEYRRSEGLAIASLDLFQAGIFSADRRNPYRADAAALEGLDLAQLLIALQVSEHNPLIGLAGRLALLRRLGMTLARNPDLFGSPGRIGNLVDWLAVQAIGGLLPVRILLDAVMRGFGAIWPGRHSLAGVNLGDAWHHSAVQVPDHTTSFVPFHKLSQWLIYSLIEPMQELGISVINLDELTGLAEYRNGGLMIDIGLLEPRDPKLVTRKLDISDEPIVEWRALTVALLDRIAKGVRERLGVNAVQLPLVGVLEGGTWSAGRRIALQKRPGGAPPLEIASDGTVF